MTCRYCKHCNEINNNNLKDDKKICKDCKELKPINLFNVKIKIDGIIKMRAECKACQVHRNKKAYARRKAKLAKKNINDVIANNGK